MALTAGVAILGTAGLAAQAPGGAVYSAVTVKVNRSTETGASYIGRPGGGVTIRNNTLRNIVRLAYGLTPSQVVEGPDWIDRTRFDIVAVADSNPSGDDRAAMARNMLADRFKLAVRKEMRPLPVYALVPVRQDGRLGPSLKPSPATDCPRYLSSRMAYSLGAGGPPQCGMENVPGTLRGGAARMPDVASALSAFADRLIVDKTGLTGAFDLELSYSMPFSQGAAAADRPSLFAAVQEQLGLKLDPQVSAVEVLVIDRAEMPTED
jgi:uncharacterized protein (TIGR03435 family)